MARSTSRKHLRMPSCGSPVSTVRMRTRTPSAAKMSVPTAPARLACARAVHSVHCLMPALATSGASEVKFDTVSTARRSTHTLTSWRFTAASSDTRSDSVAAPDESSTTRTCGNAATERAAAHSRSLSPPRMMKRPVSVLLVCVSVEATRSNPAIPRRVRRRSAEVARRPPARLLGRRESSRLSSPKCELAVNCRPPNYGRARRLGIEEVLRRGMGLQWDRLTDRLRVR